MIEIKEKFENKYWRLNNLYWIIDKNGKRVPFRMNWAQEKFFDELWYLNILLKARQFGGTTFVDLYFLDECIFNPNVEAGIIAHNKEDAQKIFRRKVQYPYRNLPDQIKNTVYPVTDSQQELAFNNNSAIYVGTSMRSGTLQYLHVSEHGKICRKYPEKAEEIKTGSLNAVEAGQMVIIESTAEGAVGDFYDFFKIAEKNELEGKKLTKLDWKKHFFPWYWNPDYSIDPAGIEITEHYKKYFANTERKCNVTFTAGQKAWYVKKAEMMGKFMKREYPSTSEEAFEHSGQMFDFSIDHHVIEPIPIPRGAEIYFTFDWGFGAPYSIGYWWVDADGRIYRFSEIYGQSFLPEEYGKNIGRRETGEQIADRIHEHEGKLKGEYHVSFERIHRLAGPDCFSKKPNYQGSGQGPSTAEEFAKKGIYITPGDPSRELKIRQFHQRLQLYSDRPPMMLVYNTCTEFIRTIPMQVPDENNIEYINTKVECHAFDEACHIMMARPLALDIGTRLMSETDKRVEELEKKYNTETTMLEHENDLAWQDLGAYDVNFGDEPEEGMVNTI